MHSIVPAQPRELGVLPRADAPVTTVHRQHVQQPKQLMLEIYAFGRTVPVDPRSVRMVKAPTLVMRNATHTWRAAKPVARDV